MMKPPVDTPVVLVVEDEMVLRMRAVDIVEDAGFVPVEAVSADQAIEILESRDDISSPCKSHRASGPSTIVLPASMPPVCCRRTSMCSLSTEAPSCGRP